MAAKKQTTIRVDSWIAEALSELADEISVGCRIRKPTMSLLISRLIAEYKRNEFENMMDKDNLPLGLPISNGFVEVGDIVIAINGQSDIYTAIDVVETEIGKGLVLSPSDKWTYEPIYGRTVFRDYAILKKGSKQ